MQDNEKTMTLPRAQGEQTIPWPASIAGEPATCCVALRVEVTQDRAQGDLDILSDTPHVGVGEPEQTLRVLLEGGIEEGLLDVILGELDALGWIDPRCPLKLEWLHVTAGRAVHLEAAVLPIASEQVSELVELLSSDSDPAVSHGLGLMYAEDLEQVWREGAPDGRLPLRYLEDTTGKPATLAHLHAPPSLAGAVATLTVD
jgi:hypothetical protein